MALWNEKVPKEKEVSKEREFSPPPKEPAVAKEPEKAAAPVNYDLSRQAKPEVKESTMKETTISAGLAIEGKIEGAGHVRIAGNFKGDVHVQGNLTIEPGARLTGGVRAATVIIGGELEGNIDAASRVELLQTGVLTGDLKAGSLTVAAGSRMRGRVEFGWDEKVALKTLTGSSSV